ncbi:hypothetical protein [Anabaena catenula]|uniref:Uncharacterized protein n=1 Tax=Anabaena catenula FACHB-362 TaxID=2692877 RepID=A0ABR8J2E1_9NOST|nr:hypothetical protein [Anabaena catenula]MBD2691226.1 hypothetical protein [Anabaena catenula FACHB-362]
MKQNHTLNQQRQEDLLHALKSEQILRDNKKLFANNQDLVVNNLAKSANFTS